MGRKPLPINPRTVERLARRGCSNREIAAYVGCDEKTIRNNFSADAARGRECGKTMLRTMQWRSARRGSVPMQIHLGKQMLDQSDKLQTDVQHTLVDDPIVAFQADPSLLERALQLGKEMSNAVANSDALLSRRAGLQGLEVPAPPPSAGGKGNGTAHERHKAPPDCPDPS